MLLNLAKGLPDPYYTQASQLRETVQNRLDQKQEAAEPNKNVEVINADEPAPVSRAEGTLESVDCNRKPVKLELRTKLALFTFYVEDRAKFPGLACGVQKRPVAIVYEQANLPGVGRAGVIRQLEWR